MTIIPPLLGSDQMPLLRGILRTLVIRQQYPDVPVQYWMHDADTLGRPGTSPLALTPHPDRGWATWLVTFPWTPRLPAMPQSTREALAKRSIPPPAYNVKGSGAEQLLVSATFTTFLAQSLQTEIDWLVRLGADQHRASLLRACITSSIGLPLNAATQRISNHILAAAGYESIPIGSSTERFSGRCELDAYADRLPEGWRWNGQRAPGSNLPRGKYLGIELGLRGTLFATSLPYWDEVRQLGETLGISVPPYVRVLFPSISPPCAITDLAPDLSALRDTRLADLWQTAWASRPTLFSAYLLDTLSAVVDGARIEFSH